MYVCMYVLELYCAVNNLWHVRTSDMRFILYFEELLTNLLYGLHRGREELDYTGQRMG